MEAGRTIHRQTAVGRPRARRFIDRIDRTWAVAILFTNGWNLALPVPGPTFPILFTPIQVVRGVFIFEVLLIAYFAFVVFTYGGSVPVARGNARKIAFLIAAIGVLALLSALINVRPMKDLVSAGRYFLLAAYFLSTVYWVNRYGATFVLRTFLFAVWAGAAVNLYFTFKWGGSQQLGGLPMLFGQSGPGGYLGVAIILSAWLMLIRRTSLDLVVAVMTSLTGLLAVSISFSKLAMLMAACGALGWCFVLWQDFNTRRIRRWYVAIAVVLAVMAALNSGLLMHYLTGVNKFIEFKFRQLDPMSIATRSQYFVITGEILLRYPVLGAGLGGFYEAAIATEAYKSKRAVTEIAELGMQGQSHPESSFLYYAAGIGVVGLIVVGILFVIGLELTRRALWRYRLAGKALWVSFACGYVIFGLTLPTLFNSFVFYLPVAVAVRTGWSLRTVRTPGPAPNTVRLRDIHRLESGRKPWKTRFTF